MIYSKPLFHAKSILVAMIITGMSVLLSSSLKANEHNLSTNVGLTGNIDRGARIYQRCKACHSLDRSRSGPKHCGVLGRRAGTVPGYTFSEALKGSDIIWTPETLDQFLKAPLKMVPGTRMYASVSSPTDRADLIAFLDSAASDPDLCPTVR